MLFRTFLLFLILAGGYLVYDSARLYFAKHAVEGDPDGSILTPESADITIVAFFEYGSPTAMKLHPVLTESLRRAKNVRYIPRPVFGKDEGSRLSALFVYAAGRQGKFIDAHNLLIQRYRRVDTRAIAQLGENLKLNSDQLQNDMKDPALYRLINKNQKYARILRVRTLPAFLVNGRIIWFITDHVPGVTDFLRVFEEARSR